MNKIRISSISGDVFSQRGFDSRGCYGSSCKDACCVYGCDVDRESYDLIFQHRTIIESAVNKKLEDCFEQDWSSDREYLGGSSIRAKKGESGYCAFHVVNIKGCVLYLLAKARNLPRRIIPSICRLYPLTWDNGVIGITKDFQSACNCLDKENASCSTILETQKREIEDIFKFLPEELFHSYCKNDVFLKS